MEDNVRVLFGADISGLTAGTASASADIESVQAPIEALTASMTALTAAVTEGFSSMAVGSRAAGAEVEAAGEKGAAGWMHLSGVIRENVAGIGRFRASFMDVAEVVMAAFAVEAINRFGEQMAKTAEETYHAALTFGLTTEQVQRLKAEAAGLGLEWSAFNTAMMRSDKALTTAREGSKAAAEAFKQVGVDIKQPIDNLTLFNKEIAGLAAVADVPTRVGLAMQLFGRNIQQIAPLIGITKEQLDELNSTIDHSGAVDVEAQEKGRLLAEAYHNMAIAGLGLGNVMTDALAPSLTIIVNKLADLIIRFDESYKSGGAAMVLFQTLGAIMGGVATAAIVLARGFMEIGDQARMAVHAVGELTHTLAFDAKGALEQHALYLKAVQDNTEGAAKAALLLKEIWAAPERSMMPPLAPGSTDVVPDLSLKKAKGYTPHMEYAAIEVEQKKIEALTVTHLGTLSHLNEKAAGDFQKKWMATYNATWEGYYKTFSKIGEEGKSIFNGLITGQLTWAQAFQKIGLDILDAFENMGIHMIASWAATEATKSALSKAGATERGAVSLLETLKSVTNNAVAAATAAYNAMAGIPIIGPALGAAAAATTFVAVEAFGALASAEGGWDRVPHDQLSMIHKDEMVLPASLAAGVRAAFGSGGDGSRPANDSGGTHHWHISAVDAPSFVRMLEQNPDALHRIAERHARNGRVSTGRSA